MTSASQSPSTEVAERNFCGLSAVIRILSANACSALTAPFDDVSKVDISTP